MTFSSTLKTTTSFPFIGPLLGSKSGCLIISLIGSFTLYLSPLSTGSVMLVSHSPHKTKESLGIISTTPGFFPQTGFEFLQSSVPSLQQQVGTSLAPSLHKYVQC